MYTCLQWCTFSCLCPSSRPPSSSGAICFKQHQPDINKVHFWRVLQFCCPRSLTSGIFKVIHCLSLARRPPVSRQAILWFLRVLFVFQVILMQFVWNGLATSVIEKHLASCSGQWFIISNWSKLETIYFHYLLIWCMAVCMGIFREIMQFCHRMMLSWNIVTWVLGQNIR